MSRFNRFTALRWVYNIIVPPRYRDKLNITEELCALESAVNKVIEVTNNNGKALEAISQDLEDIQFGAGGYYRPTITENEDGSVTFSFVASDDSMPPIEEKTFFFGSGGYYRPAITENEDGSVTFSFVASDDSMPPIEKKTFFLGDMQTITDMLEGFNGDPMEVKNYIDEMSGGYYTPVFGQSGNTVSVSFRASNKMLPALEGYSFTLPSGSPGKSAYEIAVDNGFKGSVEDFFASLKGDTYALTTTDKDEIAQTVIEILGGQPVFGYVDKNNNIKLNTGLDVGSYKLYYDDGNGNLIEVGSMTVEEVNDEPEPVSYTVTFVADGVTVATVPYMAGATSIEEPTVPAKDGYSGVWESYSLNDTNITVNAVYTADAPTVNNLLDTAGYKTGYRIKTSTGEEEAKSGVCCTGFMPITLNDILYIKGITTHATANYNAVVYYDNYGNVISATNLVGDTTDCNNGVYSTSPKRLAASTGDITKFRFSCATITDDTIVTVNKPIE